MLAYFIPSPREKYKQDIRECHYIVTTTTNTAALVVQYNRSSPLVRPSGIKRMELKTSRDGDHLLRTPCHLSLSTGQKDSPIYIPPGLPRYQHHTAEQATVLYPKLTCSACFCRRIRTIFTIFLFVKYVGVKTSILLGVYPRWTGDLRAKSWAIWHV